MSLQNCITISEDLKDDVIFINDVLNKEIERVSKYMGVPLEIESFSFDLTYLDIKYKTLSLKYSFKIIVN